MDAQQRTRSCTRQPRSRGQTTPHGSKQICIPMTPEVYDRIWNDAGEVRRFLEPLIRALPELFPAGIEDGFQLSGRLPESEKMPGIRLRQLRVQEQAYTLRPRARAHQAPQPRATSGSASCPLCLTPTTLLSLTSTKRRSPFTTTSIMPAMSMDSMGP